MSERVLWEKWRQLNLAVEDAELALDRVLSDLNAFEIAHLNQFRTEFESALPADPLWIQVAGTWARVSDATKTRITLRTLKDVIVANATIRPVFGDDIIVRRSDGRKSGSRASSPVILSPEQIEVLATAHVQRVATWLEHVEQWKKERAARPKRNMGFSPIRVNNLD